MSAAGEAAPYPNSLKICGYRGYPDKEGIGRLFTKTECEEMNGTWFPSGECHIGDPTGAFRARGVGAGSFSWNCGALNKNPYAIAYSYRWHAGAAVAAAVGLWWYAKRR